VLQIVCSSSSLYCVAILSCSGTNAFHMQKTYSMYHIVHDWDRNCWIMQARNWGLGNHAGARTWISWVSRYSDWATGWMFEELWFDSQQGQEIFLFSATSRMGLEPTHSSLQWELGTLLSGIMRAGHGWDTLYIYCTWITAFRTPGWLSNMSKVRNHLLEKVLLSKFT